MGNRQQTIALCDDVCPAGVINKTPDKCFTKKKHGVVSASGDAEGSPDGADDRPHRGLEKHNAEVFEKDVADAAGQPNRRSSDDSIKNESSTLDCIQVGVKAPVVEDSGKKTTKADVTKWIRRGFQCGTNPLIAKIKAEKYKEVEAILAEFPDCINEEDRNDQTALFYASSTGHMELVNLLIDYGAEIQCENKHGYTPLLRSLRYNQIDIAQELLKHHADINAVDAFHVSAMQVAAVAGHENSVECCLQQQGGQGMMAQKDDEGSTPLLAAVRKAHVAVVDHLLEAKSPPNLADNSGRSPLLYALAVFELDIVQLLIGNGANVNAEDEHGKTVLAGLVENVGKHKDLPSAADALVGVAAALEGKADPNHARKARATPLFLAVQYDHPMMCAMLLCYGANPHVKDKSDQSAYAMADSRGHIDICRILQEFGVSKAKDKTEPSPTGSPQESARMSPRPPSPTSSLHPGGPSPQASPRQTRSRPMLQAKSMPELIDDESDMGGPSDEENQEHAMTTAKQAWQDQVRQAMAHWGRIQHGARVNESEIVVMTLEKILQEDEEKAVNPKDQASNLNATAFTTDTMFSDFSRQRRQEMTKKGVACLRKMRSVQRRNKLRKLSQDLEEWKKQTDRDLVSLQRIVSTGIGSVKVVKLADVEKGDPYNKKCDDFQNHVLQQPMEMVSKYPISYEEYLAALRLLEGPSQEQNPLVCKKCSREFLAIEQREKHEANCKSEIWKADQNLMKDRQRLKVESCIHHITDAAKGLFKGSQKCEEMLQSLKESRDIAKRPPPKGTPEVLYCFSGLYDLLNTLLSLYNSTALASKSRASLLAEEWNLKDPFLDHGSSGAAIKFCRICFVKEINRACDHVDTDVKPHKCLCSPCAFELQLRLKIGETVLCPLCERPITKLLVTRLAPETQLRG